MRVFLKLIPLLLWTAVLSSYTRSEATIQVYLNRFIGVVKKNIKKIDDAVIQIYKDGDQIQRELTTTDLTPEKREQLTASFKKRFGDVIKKSQTTQKKVIRDEKGWLAYFQKKSDTVDDADLRLIIEEHHRTFSLLLDDCSYKQKELQEQINRYLSLYGGVSHGSGITIRENLEKKAVLNDWNLARRNFKEDDLFKEALKIAGFGAYKQALKLFRQVISINPFYVEAYTYAGLCHYRMKNYASSTFYIEKSLELNTSGKVAKKIRASLKKRGY